MKKIKNKKLIVGIVAIILLIAIVSTVVIHNINTNNQLKENQYLQGENANSSLIANNIKKGITIGGITGTLESLDTSDANARPEDILEGKTAYVNGVKITGTWKEPVEFSTNYGRIEVIWIDQQNKVIEKPLSPESSLQGMTPVKWNGTTESIAKADNSDGWYNYVSGTGTEDNLNSHWANAKDSKGSYFVWVPRYAYRIVYYADKNSDVETGYYDGRGMVNNQGVLQNNLKLEEGIETVEYEGKSYIVHPAFETNVDLGGWSGDLAGIWVGKYETSGSESDMKIVPNADTITRQTVGIFYNYGYNYDRTKESHLMKNSEWGAVAYLTHSQYGRNGNEIYINNDYNITGNSGGSTNAGPSGTKYAYNTEEGQKASSTGNIYGIYDLSGGCYEYVAAYDNKGGSELSYGNTFASKDGKSTKYATAYTNGTYTNLGEKIYEIGKTGDATKEVYLGSSSRNWNDDYSYILYSSAPFFTRGSGYDGGSGAGVFYSGAHSGEGYAGHSFRIVLGGVEI